MEWSGRPEIEVFVISMFAKVHFSSQSQFLKQLVRAFLHPTFPGCAETHFQESILGDVVAYVEKSSECLVPG